MRLRCKKQRRVRAANSNFFGSNFEYGLPKNMHMVQGDLRHSGDPGVERIGAIKTATKTDFADELSAWGQGDGQYEGTLEVGEGDTSCGGDGALPSASKNCRRHRAPLKRQRSLTWIKCGLVKVTVGMPWRRKIASQNKTVEPLPLVPATVIGRGSGSGPPAVVEHAAAVVVLSRRSCRWPRGSSRLQASC